MELKSLNDESLRKLLAEVEATVSTRPIIAECLSDIHCLVLLCPMLLLTMKSRLTGPPPGRGHTYEDKQWRRVQHLANEFLNQVEEGNSCNLANSSQVEQDCQKL